MDKIGLFYGSDTGCTEAVARLIRDLIGLDKVDVYDVYDIKGDEPKNYNKQI